MEYRKFGNTDYEVSEIGFGTWPLAGDKNGALAYGKVDDNESKEALKTAYENGINFYDTSDFYGFGYVETIMGEVFQLARDEIIITTKVGMTSIEGIQDFSTDHMVKSIEGSLKRLGTDYIDIYMLHSPPLDILTDGRILSLLDIFKIEGKIREFGISLIGPNDGFRAIQEFNFNIMELNYNIVDHRAKQSGLFDLCKEKNVATIIRTPLGQGILSGEFKYNSDESDRRNSMPRERYDKINNAYSRMFNVAKSNVTRAQLALQYCLAEPAVSCVIPGMKTINEVNENCETCELEKLSDEELSLINEIYEKEQL